MTEYDSQPRPPLPPRPPTRRTRSSLKALMGASLGSMLVFGLLVFVPLFIWFGCRIEPGQDEIAILVRKTGEDLPSGQVLAVESGQKGIQLEVLPEGRYFKNPYTWGWEIKRVNDIPAGKLGVLTRLYGADLAASEILAQESTKGIVEEVLRPGKYRINPYAYFVELFDAITIRPGHVGVVTSLVGKDVLSHDLAAEARNAFIVGEGMKGVLPEVLDPGTYYLNPYVFNVVEVDLRSQRLLTTGEDVISFLTEDGFTVTVEGAIEYALQRDKAALLTHRVGDMDDIIKKVIIPRARGFSRIEGSKHPAIDYIVGETRQLFQSELEKHLRDKTTDWGVEIKSVLVSKIIVPDEIASISRDREIAVQDAAKYEQQIAQAKSKAELVKQEMLAEQNKEKVEADTARIRAVINAEQTQAVQVVAARRELEVAKLNLETAAFQAQAILRTAEGERDAIRARNEAEASVLADRVKAFGDGMSLARYQLYDKLGPQIESVLSSDAPPGLGALFTPFLPAGKGVTP